MKLTLLRHGVTRGNRDRLCYGSTDLPLLPEGVEALHQAAATYHYPSAQHYYTSGMRRTEETFRLVYGNRPHEILTGLREMEFGEAEMKTVEEVEKSLDFRTWAEDKTGTLAIPGGESFLELRNRVLSALTPLILRDEDCVCVMHGGSISSVLSLWFPGRQIWEYMPHPGTGFQISFEEGRPVEFHPVPTEQ